MRTKKNRFEIKKKQEKEAQKRRTSHKISVSVQLLENKEAKEYLIANDYIFKKFELTVDLMHVTSRNPTLF